MSDRAAGILFLVATPIGNLEDFSFRAMRVLREASLIAAEDTRHTAKLLHHYDIRRPTTSLHEHNEQEEVPALVDKFRAGAGIALVTDAGTPAVSDPGYRLVRAAVDAGIRVEAIPAQAPCSRRWSRPASRPTLPPSGLPPPKQSARRAWFRGACGRAPHLRVLRGAAPYPRNPVGRPVVATAKRIGRELTKLHDASRLSLRPAGHSGRAQR